MTRLRRLALAASLLALSGVAQAAPVTFFGEDLGSNGAVLTTHANADAARADFFTNLQGVGTETFEGFANGKSAPFSVNFAGSGTATLAGTGSVSSTIGTGRYPISGTKFFDTSGKFNLSFTDPISAFGFYGIDIGDVGASLVLTLTGSNGVSTLNVPNVVNSTTADGSVLYFGFYDTANTYSAISFAGAGNDFFGFDDFSIGSRAQVAPSAVPEPASWAMMIAGVGAVGFAMRRRAKVSTSLKFA